MERPNGCPHERPRLSELTRAPMAIRIGSWLESSALLVLITDRPVGIRDVMLLQEIQPSLSRDQV